MINCENSISISSINLYSLFQTELKMDQGKSGTVFFLLQTIAAYSYLL